MDLDEEEGDVRSKPSDLEKEKYRRESPGTNVEAYDLVGDNKRASHQNHATWIKDDRRHVCTPDTDNDEVRVRGTVRMTAGCRDIKNGLTGEVRTREGCYE
jgi:hypothetical protein